LEWPELEWYEAAIDVNDLDVALDEVRVISGTLQPLVDLFFRIGHWHPGSLEPRVA
jgi:hypothetical protein